MEKNCEKKNFHIMPYLVALFACIALAACVVRVLPKAPAKTPEASIAATPAPTPSPTPEASVLPQVSSTPEASAAPVYTKTRVLVDGEVIGTLMSREAADLLLDELITHFMPDVMEGALESATFLNEITLGEAEETDDIVSQDTLFERLTAKDTPIRVEVVSQATTSEEVVHKSTEKKDDTIPEGVRIVERAGQDGVLMHVTRVVYINGEKQTQKETETVVVTEAIDASVRIGTKKIKDNAVPKKKEGKRGKSAGDLRFALPVKGKVLVYYGGYKGAMHYGVDYKAAAGTDVVAAEAGTVVSVLNRGGYGLTVEIDHGGGFLTRYALLGEVVVALGDTVSRGDVIAKAGDSDNACNAALHFELRIDGEAYNPYLYLG